MKLFRQFGYAASALALLALLLVGIVPQASASTVGQSWTSSRVYGTKYVGYIQYWGGVDAQFHKRNGRYRVDGRVKDAAADGWCVQAVIRWYNSSGKRIDTDASKWDCPASNPDYKAFAAKAGDSTRKRWYFATVTVRQII